MVVAVVVVEGHSEAVVRPEAADVVEADSTAAGYIRLGLGRVLVVVVKVLCFPQDRWHPIHQDLRQNRSVLLILRPQDQPPQRKRRRQNSTSTSRLLLQRRWERGPLVVASQEPVRTKLVWPAQRQAPGEHFVVQQWEPALNSLFLQPEPPDLQEFVEVLSILYG